MQPFLFYVDSYSSVSEPMSAAANPFDASRAHLQVDRMHQHLGFHRAGLCDSIAHSAIQYASEVYPVGDVFSTDCTRVAFAVFTFLVGTNPRQAVGQATNGERSPLRGMACPLQSGNTPLVHYISLTGNDADPFDTSSGHRLVILQAGSRVRVLHAFQGRYTLAQYAREHASMSSTEFAAWWAALQTALGMPEMSPRATCFTTLIGAAFDQPVFHSWIISRNADLSG